MTSSVTCKGYLQMLGKIIIISNKSCFARWYSLKVLGRLGQRRAKRLVFTSDGVGVVIRSVELHNLVKTGSLVSQAEAEELDQSQSVGRCIVIGLSFHLCF